MLALSAGDPEVHLPLSTADAESSEVKVRRPAPTAHAPAMAAIFFRRDGRMDSRSNNRGLLFTMTGDHRLAIVTVCNVGEIDYCHNV